MSAVAEFLREWHLLEWVSMGFVAAGLVFFFGAVVGVIRFPDFYTRMHAAGKGDTLSSLLIVIGLAVFNLADFSWANVLVSVKILMICAFVFVTSPTTTHALMEAGHKAGLKPWSNPESDEFEGGEDEEATP